MRDIELVLLMNVKRRSVGKVCLQVSIIFS
jgi:hypothetical protein